MRSLGLGLDLATKRLGRAFGHGHFENCVSIKNRVCLLQLRSGSDVNVLLLYCGSQKKIARQCLGTVGTGEQGTEGRIRVECILGLGFSPRFIAEALYVVGWWGSYCSDTS